MEKYSERPIDDAMLLDSYTILCLHSNSRSIPLTKGKARALDVLNPAIVRVNLLNFRPSHEVYVFLGQFNVLCAR